MYEARYVENTNLDGLSVIPKHIHTYNCLVEVGVCALRDIVVEVLLVSERVHTLEDKLE